MEDCGKPTMFSDEIPIEINIIDINNNEPVITYPTEEIRIYKVSFVIKLCSKCYILIIQNASVGNLVDKSGRLVKFEATDKDIYEPYHTIRFTIANNEYFGIEASTGQIILDTELPDQERFQVLKQF